MIPLLIVTAAIAAACLVALLAVEAPTPHMRRIAIGAILFVGLLALFLAPLLVP